MKCDQCGLSFPTSCSLIRHKRESRRYRTDTGIKRKIDDSCNISRNVIHPRRNEDVASATNDNVGTTTCSVNIGARTSGLQQISRPYKPDLYKPP